MPPQIEQIVDSSVRAQKPLGLMSGFEASHDPLSDPGWLMGKLCSIVGILGRVMDRIRYEFAVSDPIASLLIGNYYSRLIAINFE